MRGARVAVHRGLLGVLVCGLVLGLAPPARAQDGGVDGDRYVSPTFGYSVSWDGELWSAEDEFSEDGYDLLLLESEGASLYFEGVYFYQGDPEECLEGERLRVAEDAGFDDVEQLTNDDGEPIENQGDDFSWAMYDQPESEDGEVPASIVFIECQTLVTNSVVLIKTAFIDPEQTDFWEPAVFDVLDTIEAPAVPAAEVEEGDVEQLMRASVVDINQMWTGVFADLGEEYVDPKMIAVTGPTETECGDAFPGETGSFYCPADLSIYIDVPDSMENDLSYGEVFFQVVIAHEIGHHVQELLQLTGCTETTCGEDGSSLAIELQADCFAGVWMSDAAYRGVIDERELDRVEIAVKTFLGDPIDVPADDPEAHGTGDQRFEMFMAGYLDGISACGL